MKKVLLVLAIAAMCGSVAHAAYSSGTNNGYFWSLYREGGSASISFGSGGNFAISYSNVNDVVGGKGWSSGAARNIGYNIGSLSGSYNFVGVYGWTRSPLIEYYVAEKGSATGGTSCGSVSSDGHTYQVHKQQRVNAPSIDGTQTFWQYKSSWGGAPTGSNRSITMANHFNYWKGHCGSMGSYGSAYQIFALEAWGGKSGYINATVWEGGGGSTTTTTTSGGSTTTTTTSGGGSYYQMRNRNTGNCAGVNSSSNNADVLDLSCNGSSMRKWALQDAGSGYYYIVNQSTGKAMRASGSDVIQYTLSSGYWSEMFSREDVGDGYYTYKNRNTNTCLRATGGDIVLYSCNSGYWSEMFIRE